MILLDSRDMFAASTGPAAPGCWLHPREEQFGGRAAHGQLQLQTLLEVIQCDTIGGQ
jgi:hypothetical protein